MGSETAEPSIEPKLVPVALTVTAFFALWTGWVLVLLQFPDAFNGDTFGKGLLRACIRLVLWVGPLVAYARWVERRPLIQTMLFTERWRAGLIGGAILCGISVALCLLRIQFQGAEVHAIAQIGAGTWLNPILTAPLVEELMFRGLVFRALDRRIGFVVALVVSSALFALIHFPYWYLADVHSGVSMVRELGAIFLIGVVLGCAMKATGSVLTPLIGHWANNIASIVVK